MLGGTRLAVYDDVPCELLCARAGAPRLVAVDHCASTMDLAHQCAIDGGPHGAVVVAEQQGAGRGRTGKTWTSVRGAGVWASVLLRHPATAPPGVLSLRVGIALADALDRHTPASIQLKWPNDLFLHGRKLAGILTEARWRGAVLEWIVVGVGVNLRESGAAPPVATLDPGSAPAVVLVDVIRSVLSAGALVGELSRDELASFARRDLALGRELTAPVQGRVVGIDSRGGIRVRTASGERVAMSGSLMFSTPLAE